MGFFPTKYLRFILKLEMFSQALLLTKLILIYSNLATMIYVN